MISARTTLGGAEPQLEVHVEAGFNVGLSAREVVEAISTAFPTPGSHASLMPPLSPSRVFEERGLSPTIE
jgi:4-carboxymuconolactone decarboxylase